MARYTYETAGIYSSVAKEGAYGTSKIFHYPNRKPHQYITLSYETTTK